MSVHNKRILFQKSKEEKGSSSTVVLPILVAEKTKKGSLDFIRKRVGRARASVPCGYGKTEKTQARFCQIVLQKL